MRHYEIWWADLPKPAGRCPVMLLSRPDAYGYLNKFIVAEITNRIRGIPVEIGEKTPRTHRSLTVAAP